MCSTFPCLRSHPPFKASPSMTAVASTRRPSWSTSLRPLACFSQKTYVCRFTQTTYGRSPFIANSASSPSASRTKGKCSECSSAFRSPRFSPLAPVFLTKAENDRRGAARAEGSVMNERRCSQLRAQRRRLPLAFWLATSMAKSCPRIVGRSVRVFRPLPRQLSVDDLHAEQSGDGHLRHRVLRARQALGLFWRAGDRRPHEAASCPAADRRPGGDAAGRRHGRPRRAVARDTVGAIIQCRRKMMLGRRTNRANSRRYIELRVGVATGGP